MSEAFRGGYRDFLQRAKRRGIQSEDDVPLGFADAAAESFKLFRAEEQTGSRNRQWQQELETEEERLKESAGAVPPWWAELRRRPPAELEVEREAMREGQTGPYPRLRSALQQWDALRETYPDLRSEADMWLSVQDRLRQAREDYADRLKNKDVATALGEAAGVLGGAATDPLVLATLPFGGAPASAGRQAGVLARAGRVALGEAAIGAGVEAIIQPAVYGFKQDIDSPYTIGDALLNIGAAGAGGAILGGGFVALREGARSAYTRLAAQHDRLVADGRVQPTAETEAARDAIVEVGEVQQASLFPSENVQAQTDHLRAYERARVDVEQGRAADVEGIVGQHEVPGARAPRPSRLEEVDPAALEIDAERFQFKAADAQGVTDRLRGVERFDQRLAGVAVVYEQADGRRFIVDGHQRVNLARRALAGGQDPDEVRMTAFALREVDGVTPQDARVLAAVKNIAEGTGTALDAAKVLRELGPGGRDALPPLPPQSALVRDAEGLARLGDEPFQAAVNEVIDQRYAAIVGRLMDDPGQQGAAIQVLRQADPPNARQAQMIVEQVRAADFETRTTEDLFGEQSVTESLYAERAKVLDASLSRLRQGRATFRTLQSRSTEIQSTGANQLDEIANAQRLNTDEQAIDTVARLANLSGPISDALGDAARALKAGRSTGAVVNDFLGRVRSELGNPGESGAVARGGRPEGEAAGGPGAEVAAAGRPVDPIAHDLGLPDPPITLKGEIFAGRKPKDADALLRETITIETKARKQLRQRMAQEIAAEGVPVEGRKPIIYLMGGGGASGKGTVLRALQEAGDVPRTGVVHLDPDEVKVRLPEFQKIKEAGDSRAAAVVHEESSLISGMAADLAMAKRADIVSDRTMGGSVDNALEDIQTWQAAGYEVRLFGVTAHVDEAVSRAVGRARRTGRYVPTPMLMKAHKGFSANFERYADEADRVVLFDNNGEVPLPIARKEAGGALRVEDEARYAGFQAKGGLDETAETIAALRESAIPDDFGDLLSGARVGEGVPEGQAGAGARGAGEPAGPPGGVPPERLSTLPEGMDRAAGVHLEDLGDDMLGPVTQAQLREAQDLLDNLPEDFRLPEGVRLGEDGELEVASRSAREVFAELDSQERALDDLTNCYLGERSG